VSLPVPVIEVPFPHLLSDAGGAAARRRRPSQPLRLLLSLLLPLFHSSSMLSSSVPVVLSKSETTVLVMFTGDFRCVLSFASTAHCFFLTGMCLLRLRSVRTSFLLDISTCLLLGNFRRHLSSIPPQVQLPSTTSVVLNTGSRGAPHIIRSLDPVLYRSVSLCPSRIYFTSTAAGLMDDSHEISPLGVFSARATSITPSPFIPPLPKPLPCPLTGTSSFLHRRCSRVIAVILVRRCPSVLARVMGPYRFIIGMASPTLFKGPHLNLKAAVSQPTSMWGGLILLFNPRKDFSGFTVFFTETLHTFQYSSCLKSILSPQLPVDSPGPSKPSLALLLFIEERDASPSSMRNNFPSDLVWRSLSISIAFLLSCGAVCSGPEDATDFVSTIFRGGDWMPTSHYKVTISQASGCAMNLASTHLSFALNSLSHYFKGLSISIVYVLLLFVCRVCLNSYLNCRPDV
ncbi:unnamed protein product, partial [Brassica oleracea]